MFLGTHISFGLDVACHDCEMNICTLWTSSGRNDVNTFRPQDYFSWKQKDMTHCCILHSKVKFYVNRNKNFSHTLYYNVIHMTTDKKPPRQVILPTDVSLTHSWSWFRSTNKQKHH